MACVQNEDKSQKYGNFDYFDYAIKTWEYWCRINDCTFYLMDEPYISDMDRYRINWQKEVFVFDYYKNEKINEIKIGFRFIFQSKESTITDKEVDKVINNIINGALKHDSVSIPGIS